MKPTTAWNKFPDDDGRLRVTNNYSDTDNKWCSGNSEQRWHWPVCIISTRDTILSMCLRAAMRPRSIRILKYSNMSLPKPPIT